MNDERIRALVIPPNDAGPLKLQLVPRHGLDWVREALGCRTVQAIYCDDFVTHGLTGYADEEGLYRQPFDPCRTAMDYLMPWYGMHAWPGGIVICGFDADRGVHEDRDPLASPRLKTVIDESGRDVEDLREASA